MSTLIVEQDRELLTLILDNLAYGNSFGPSEADQLVAALNSHKGVKGIIFQSASNKIFCAGGNLKHYASLKNRKVGLKDNNKIRKALRALAKVKCPTVAVVQGDCFGGGMELLSCFDRVIATPSGMFGFWQRRISLTFGWGGGSRWVDKIGLGQVRNLCLEARSLCAYEALRLGLVDEVVSGHQLQATGKIWLERMQKLPQEPVKKIKCFQAKTEVQAFEDLWMNSEHVAILKKFKP